MKKDIVKNAVICLSHLKIEDTTFEIARDIVIEEYEQQKEEIERLNNIIKEAREYVQTMYTYGIKNNSLQRNELLEILDKGEGNEEI